MWEKIIQQENIESGYRMKQAREAMGKTQEELADELGISTSALKKIEGGQNGVSSDILRKMLKMNVSSDYILEGKRQSLEQLLLEVENSTPIDKLSLLVKLIVDYAEDKQEGKLSSSQVMQLIEMVLNGNKQDEESANS